MATALVPNQVNRGLSGQTAVNPTTILAAADNTGQTFVNNERTFLRVQKTDAGALTVQILLAVSVDGFVPGPDVVTVPATTGDVVLGPFPAAIYGSTVTFNYNATATAGTKVAAFTL